MEGVLTAVLETVNDSSGRKWLVSVTLWLKRRLCVGVHVKCAACVCGCSHSRTVGRYQLNCSVSLVTQVLVTGVELSLADRRTDVTEPIVTSRICFLNAPKCAYAHRMWAFLCGSFGHQNKQ